MLHIYNNYFTNYKVHILTYNSKNFFEAIVINTMNLLHIATGTENFILILPPCS